MLKMLRKTGLTLFTLLLLVIAQVLSVQGQLGQPNARGLEPVNIDCETADVAVENGTSVTVVQLRAGYDYTATVIGIDDFDPVVITTSNTGRTTACNDNSEAAATYSVVLPRKGTVRGNDTSAQVTFRQTIADLQDVHINVGGKNGMSGEFLLIIQGLSVSQSDNGGDPYKFFITENVAASGVPITAYLFGVEDEMDPTIWTLDGGYIDYLMDGEDYIYCDDAGDSTHCWGEHSFMHSSRVNDGSETVNGGYYSAMLAIDPEVIFERDMDAFYYLMSTYDQATFGQYILVFHIGIK